MDSDDWTLFFETTPSPTLAPQTSTLTPTPIITTNNISNQQNTTSSFFDEFSFTQQNNSNNFTQFKPNDFIDLDKLKTTIPTPSSTNNTPTHITTNSMTNTSLDHSFHQNSTIFNFPTLTQQKEMHPNEFIELEKLKLNFNHATNTHQQQEEISNPEKGIYENMIALECHVRKDKLSEDSWEWKKYGQKFILGSPHPRSYYKCSSFKDCSARKLVEKSKAKEDIYVVTYLGEHNHEKPASAADWRTIMETPVNSAQGFVDKFETEFIDSFDEDDLLIYTMTTMSENFLTDINYLNGGVLYP